MSQRGEAFDSNCMTLTRFIIQAQKKHKVSSHKIIFSITIIVIHKISEFLWCIETIWLYKYKWNVHKYTECNRWINPTSSNCSNSCQGHRFCCPKSWYRSLVSFIVKKNQFYFHVMFIHAPRIHGGIVRTLFIISS